MIIDKLFNAKLYAGLSVNLYKGFQFLMQNEFDSMPAGKYEIDGDRVFAIVQEYETKPEDQGRWEAHYKYTDIQYIVQGEEKMGYVNIATGIKNEDTPAQDIYFIDVDEKGKFVHLNEKEFVVFTPQDAHMPSLCVENPAMVKKVVVKVAL